MSANNQLVILKNKKVEVHLNGCIDNPFKPSKDTLLKSFDTLKEAIKYTKEYMNEYPFVEYGYHIDNSCLKCLR